jgi:hypothetical protein
MRYILAKRQTVSRFVNKGLTKGDVGRRTRGPASSGFRHGLISIHPREEIYSIAVRKLITNDLTVPGVRSPPNPLPLDTSKKIDIDKN